MMAELEANDLAFVRKFEDAITKSNDQQTDACLEQWQKMKPEERQDVVDQMNKDNVTSVLTKNGKELIVGDPYTSFHQVKVYEQKENGWKRANLVAERAAHSSPELIKQFDENNQRKFRDGLSPEVKENIRKASNVLGAIQKAFQQPQEKQKQ